MTPLERDLATHERWTFDQPVADAFDEVVSEPATTKTQKDNPTTGGE